FIVLLLAMHPTRSSLFPYTTLFRSGPGGTGAVRPVPDRTTGQRPVARQACGGRCGAGGIEATLQRRQRQGVPFTSSAPCSPDRTDRKSTRLNSSHVKISYAVFCLKK